MMALGADVTGKWQGTATRKGAPQTFNIKQIGSSLAGTVEGGRGGSVEIKNGKVDDNSVYFEIERETQGNTTTSKYSGKVEGDTMNLTLETGRGPREVTLKKQ
jgi:hypothetical protein